MNITNIECRWFHAHPDRTYHYAMFHLDRKTTTLDGRLAVVEAGPTWPEAACRKAWRDCEQAEGVLQ
jgi:hypothetical protein